MYEEIKIDRRSSIRAEIEASIRLLLEGDFIPAHVLAFAAKGQLRGIAKNRGIVTFDDEAELRVKPQFVKVWRKAVNLSYNFFKHANDDPNLELDTFRPETTVLAVFTAIVNYGLVYGQRTLPMAIIFAWTLSRHPNFGNEKLRSNIEEWKQMFNEPEGKPLRESMARVRDVVAASHAIPPELLDRLQPDAKLEL